MAHQNVGTHGLCLLTFIVMIVSQYWIDIYGCDMMSIFGSYRQFLRTGSR